jgi:hypothetical protein
VRGLTSVPQPVYAVRFTARELWGPQGHPNDTVDLDVWEWYLERTGEPGEPEPLEPPPVADRDGPLAGSLGLASELPPCEAMNAAGPWWSGGLLPPPAALARVVESVLAEHGLVDSAAVDERVAQIERAGAVAPPPAAHLVTRAWRDDAFRARLLADANPRDLFLSELRLDRPGDSFQLTGQLGPAGIAVVQGQVTVAGRTLQTEATTLLAPNAAASITDSGTGAARVLAISPIPAGATLRLPATGTGSGRWATSTLLLSTALVVGAALVSTNWSHRGASGRV